MLKEALERIAELEAQNRALIAENNRLREILGIDVSVPSEEQKDTTEKIVSAPELPFANAAINKYSPPDEKIDLYMSLFRGREDVYAKRCYSKSHDSSYYIPACRHEWVKGICGRPQVKCKNCDKRELLPLTKEVINSHLRNKDEHGVGIIGIYPLLGDDTCLFLAVDFDEAEWQKDVTAFRDVCGKLNVPVAVERSRSGNGAHAWFFFEEAVAAVSARRLGNALLTEAMSQRHEIKFASYDRMFPNQDFMPKGGFGNLIALPLQGGARIHGNSEFVDEAFQSYPDQWAYLSSIRKMTLTDIEAFLATFGNGSNLGELANANNNGEDEITKPWEKKSSIIPLADRDFPNTLTIVEANRLYIPKQGITQRALNRIKRLAAFQNPLFYKTQKMRMSTYGIPRIIYSLEETDEYIGIPRGCQISLCQLLNEAQASYLFEDKRNTGRDIQVEFMGTLQAEQQESVDALLLHENGVLSLPTAFGKTVIGASLIAARKCNTLILVHLHTLLEQWKKSLEQFLEINETLAEEPIKRGRKKKRCIIGQIGSGKNTASGIIDIALVQSLIHNNEVDEIVKNYGMVLVDECHHVPSVNYEKVLSEVNAKYIYGLTATPIRQDGQHPIVFMQCGPIRFKVTAKEQSAKHSFEHFIVPRFTGFRKPYSLSDENWHITQIYATLAEDDARNERIVNDVKNVLDDGRTPIILTQRTEQVNCLANKLKGLTDAHIITLIGASLPKEKVAMMQKLESIPANESLVIIATGKYVGEGFDYPRLDTLFLASPIAWKGTLAQYVGRLHREYPGKQSVMVYDYVDIHVPVLERMYHKRLRGYAQLGYKVLSNKDAPEKTSLIYNAENYVAALAADIAEAKHDIIIAVPYIKKAQYRFSMEKWTTLIPTGVNVRVDIQAPTSYIIIDSHIVWYGDINLFTTNKVESMMIRLDSSELADELINLKE